MVVAASHPKILMAGVVPPPVHGQSLATRALFDADLSPLEKVLLEIRSSTELEQVGKASLGKVLGLVGIIARCLKLRLTEGPQVLYYTAGSAAMVPFVRDILFLGLCRPWFRRTVLHYHSGGLPEFLEASPLRRWIGRWIYGRGAWAIGLSAHTPVPGTAFGAGREFEVPNGLDVPALPSPPGESASENPAREFRVLFVGNLYEDKGVFDLVEACRRAAGRMTRPLRLRLVGKWPDEETQRRFEAQTAGLPDNLRIDPPGPAYGDEKWQAFATADVFAFPSFYRAENLPLVLIEALGCGLPVIAYRWRGAPSLVNAPENGLLAEPRDVEGFASALVRVAGDPAERTRMAAAGKARYERELTLDRHLAKMRHILSEACLTS